MFRSAVTISLVPEARGGPFIFWDDLAANCAKAATLGFDAVEVFPPSAEALAKLPLQEMLGANKLNLAAAGTGAGWLIHKLHLSHMDREIRGKARQFIAGIIEVASRLGAPAIIGSLQGRFENEVTRPQALAWLAEALNELGEHARQHGFPLLYEPLNRYETNLLNRADDALEFLRSLQTRNVKLLADLFHMSIEEASLPDALRAAGRDIGHVHLADSNRRPAGCGHTDFRLPFRGSVAFSRAGRSGATDHERIQNVFCRRLKAQRLAAFHATPITNTAGDAGANPFFAPLPGVRGFDRPIVRAGHGPARAAGGTLPIAARRAGAGQSEPALVAAAAVETAAARSQK